MDQNFTTTFIPKKPIVQEAPRTSRPAGLLTIISMLVFLAALIAGGGAFLYKGYVESRTEELRESIKKAEKDFEISAISELQLIDKRLSVATTILHNHRIVTPFFRLLEDTTLPTVRFSKFDFTLNEEKPATLLSGEAEGYRAIAQQSGVFAENTEIRDHIFSNFILTPRGRVSFDLVFNVDSNLLDFETQIAKGAGQSWLPNESGSPVPSEPASTVPVSSASVGTEPVTF